MAIQNTVVIDICQRLVSNATALLDILDEFESLQEQLSGAGITLTETQWAGILEENGNTQHADPIAYHTTNGSVAPALTAYLKATSTNGKTYWAWLNTLRK